MATYGGDLISATVNHPILGNHTFYAKSNEAVNKSTGGFRANDDANAISGDGLPIWTLTQERGFMEFTVANDERNREDAKFASDLAGDLDDGEWVFTHKNGVTWALTGRPVGDINPDMNPATFTMKVAGGNVRKL